MTLLKLSPNALAHCRFAISPLAETVGVMITLQRRCTDPAVARWHAEHQPAYRRWLGANPIAAALLPLIASTKRFPDMIALPPEHGMNTRLSDELATMTTFSDEQIRAGVRAAAAASWKTHRLDWLDTPNLAARTAELFQQGWQQFVEPDWPRRRGVLRARHHVPGRASRGLRLEAHRRDDETTLSLGGRQRHSIQQSALARPPHR